VNGKNFGLVVRYKQKSDASDNRLHKGDAMDKEQFIEHMMEAEETMFHLALSILHQEQDCSDAVQEAVLKAYAKRDTLKNPSCFKTWIIRILINECYTFLRRQRRQISMEPELMEGNLPDAQADFGAYVKEEYLDLYQAINSLKEQDKICVLLFYMEDYSVSEVAQILQIPEGTVKSRLHKSRIQLKDMLKEDQE